MHRLPTIEELLRALDHTVDPMAAAAAMDEIEELVEADPEGSREAIVGYPGDDGTYLRLLGFLGSPADFEFLVASLTDPALRRTALEALANQPEADRVDAIARSLLDDLDPGVRAQAISIVAFHERPGAAAALLPLTHDPVPHVRMLLAWHLGGFPEPAATAALRTLLADDDQQVRTFAARASRDRSGPVHPSSTARGPSRHDR